MKRIIVLAFSLMLCSNLSIIQAAEIGRENSKSEVRSINVHNQKIVKKHLKKWSKSTVEVQTAVKKGLEKLAAEKDLKVITKRELMALNLLPPTKDYIATIAAKYNISYNKKCKGNDMFYGAKGEPIYPENDGFIGKADVQELVPNKYLIDRFGAPRGRFFAFYGADFSSRALNKYDIEDFKNGRKEYHIYKIIKPIPDVLLGSAAPWFGEKGGCIQGMVRGSMAKYLKNGEYLVEVFDRDEADRLDQTFRTK